MSRELKHARLTSTLAATQVLIEVASREALEAREALEVAGTAGTAGLDGATPGDAPEELAIRRAGVYLFAAAALERACREGLRAVIAEIDARGVAPARLRVSLFALHCAAELDAIGGGPRSLERVARAAALFEAPFGAAHAPLGTVLPLDGRTPRAAHFATIWRVMGFPGASLPDPSWAPVLDDLADGRNDVAHGVRDAIAFGRSRSPAAVVRVVEGVERVVAHLFESADAYLDRQLFLRDP